MAKKLSAKIKIDADTKAAKKGFDDLDRSVVNTESDIKSLSDAFKLAESRTDELTGSFEEMQVKLKQLALDKATKALDGLGKEASEADREFAKVNKRLAQLQLDKATKNLRNMGVETKKTSSAFSSFAKNIIGVTAAIAAFTQGLKFAFTQARDQEVAVAKLDAALVRLGPTSAAVSEALQRQAGELQSTTGVNDNLVLASQALVAQFTTQQASIEALTERAIDLSRGLGIDLRSATLLIAKTFGSSTNALIEYGFTVEGAAGSSERLNSILAATGDVVGQAASQINNFTGQFELLRSNLGDSAENVAELATKNGDLVETLKEANSQLAEFNTRVDESPTFLSKLGVQLGGLLALFGELFAKIDPVTNTLLSFTKATEIAASGADVLGDSIESTTKTQRTMNAIFLEATNFLNDYGKALSDDEKKQRDLENSIEGTKDALRALGVTLNDDVNKKLKENEDLLTRVRIGVRQGAFHADELERAERAVAAAVDTANVSLRTQSQTLTDADPVILSYAESLANARAELDLVTAAERANANAVVQSSRERTAAREAERAETRRHAGSSFATLSGGQFDLPPQVFGGVNGRLTVGGTIGAGPSGRGVSAIGD